MSRRSSYSLYEELSNKNSEDESAKINNRNNYMYNSWISGSYDQSKCMECGNHSCICVRGCKGATGATGATGPAGTVTPAAAVGNATTVDDIVEDFNALLANLRDAGLLER